MLSPDLPACKALSDACPGATLHLLALRHSIADLAQGDPLWAAVHIIDPTRDRSLGRQAAIIKRLSSERFDASLCFFPSNTWQYNLLPFLCGIRKRFAFRYPLKQGVSLSFLNTRFLPVDPQAHDVAQNMRLAGLFAGADLSGSHIAFPRLFGETETAEARRFLGKIGGARRYIGIHPGSSAEHGMEAKRWDPLRFGELARPSMSALNAQALVFGGGEEEPLKMIAASIMKSPCQIIPPQNLRMTAALLRCCELLLCNDSGLMHMAACMGVPTAAVFGPTDERRNGPPAGDTV